MRPDALHILPLAAALVLLAAPPAGAAPTPLPEPSGWVNDFAGVLDAPAKARMIAVIEGLERRTGVELAVVTVRDAGGQEPKMLAVELLNLWGVGKKGKDNGLLLLLALKERRLEIEVGYGLEGELPDGKVVAVLRDEAVPLLRQERHGAAIEAVVRRLAAMLGGAEPAPLPPEQAPRPVQARAQPATPAAAQHSPDAWWILLALLELAGFGFLVSHFSWRRMPGSDFTAVALAAVSAPAVMTWLGLLPPAAYAASFGMLLASATTAAGLTRHRCPRCQRWMEIRSKTLRESTTLSTGLAERTYACSNCGYHDVRLITLAQKSEPSSSSSDSWSSSSSSSSSWSSSSSSGFGGFGGGSSGGGGGGVSW
jgi:uncharacterized protein